MENTPRVVLSIDDNEVDGALLQRAVKRTAVPVRLFTVTEGSQAVSYLTGEGIYGDREQYPLPELILLDIQMPKMSGVEVLHWLKSNPELKKTPVVILTSSDKAEDRATAEQGGAQGYHLKPNRFQDLQTLVKEIYAEWFEKSKKTKSSKSRAKATETNRTPPEVSANASAEGQSASTTAAQAVAAAV